jgi:hypothetical protein
MDKIKQIIVKLNLTINEAFEDIEVIVNLKPISQSPEVVERCSSVADAILNLKIDIEQTFESDHIKHLRHSHSPSFSL